MLMQIVVDFRLDEIAYKLIDARPGRFVFLWNGRPHIIRAEFGLCLAFEHWLFHIQGYGSYNTVTDIGKLLVLVVEFLDGTGNVFFQCTLMGTPLSGMLTVDKRIIFFSVLIGMCESYFNVFTFQVYYFVQPFGSHIILQQIFESMA